MTDVILGGSTVLRPTRCGRPWTGVDGEQRVDSEALAVSIKDAD